MDTFELAVVPRHQLGKKVKQLRKDGVIPVVIYGLGKEPEHGQVELRVFSKLYSQAGESSVVSVSLGDGKAMPTIIHDVDYDPVKDTVTHVDFLRIDLMKEIEAPVVLKQVGTAPAVKDLGAVVVTIRDKVTVRCLPKDLVHEIEVDLSGLTKIGDTLHLRDIPMPANVNIVDDPELMVVSIAAPRTEEIEKVAATEAAPTAEGEAAPAADGEAKEGEAKEGEAKPAGEKAPQKKGKE